MRPGRTTAITVVPALSCIANQNQSGFPGARDTEWQKVQNLMNLKYGLEIFNENYEIYILNKFKFHLTSHLKESIAVNFY